MATTLARLTRALADQPFLSSLPPAIQRQLAAHARRRDYSAGEALVTEGAIADCFFLIHRGVVRLTMEIPGAGEAEIEILGADAALGWSWLVPPHRWHLSATAVTRTSTLVFDSVRLRTVMEAEPTVGYELMRRFAAIIFERLRATQIRLVADAENRSRPR